MRYFLIAALAAVSVDAYAWGNYCDAEAELAEEFDLDGVQRVSIDAVAGDLVVTGKPGVRRATVSGRACLTEGRDRRIDEIRIEGRRTGDTLEIVAIVPRGRGGNLIGQLDLEIALPDSVSVAIDDSSGDIRVDSVASLVLFDSSGDVEVRGVREQVEVGSDSSGDLVLRDVGDVSIRIDSSGDIEIVGARSVRIGQDSSGSIEVRDVSGDVLIGRDSSGDIRVSDIAGNFVVEHDSSGDVRYRDVQGEVNVPE